MTSHAGAATLRLAEDAPADDASAQHSHVQVMMLAWPDQEDLRQEYCEQNIPCLLVVQRGVSPPDRMNPLEAWVRPAASREELADHEVYKAQLLERATARPPNVSAYLVPEVDSFNQIRFRGKTACLSRTEAAIMRCLVRQFETVASLTELKECLPKGRAVRGARNALDLHLMRLRPKLEPLGLSIRTVRDRGRILESRNAQLNGGVGVKGSRTVVGTTSCPNCSQASPNSVKVGGDLEIDLQSRNCSWRGMRIQLSRPQLILLIALREANGSFLTLPALQLELQRNGATSCEDTTKAVLGALKSMFGRTSFAPGVEKGGDGQGWRWVG